MGPSKHICTHSLSSQLPPAVPSNQFARISNQHGGVAEAVEPAEMHDIGDGSTCTQSGLHDFSVTIPWMHFIGEGNTMLPRARDGFCTTVDMHYIRMCVQGNNQSNVIICL